MFAHSLHPRGFPSHLTFRALHVQHLHIVNTKCGQRNSSGGATHLPWSHQVARPEALLLTLTEMHHSRWLSPRCPLPPNLTLAWRSLFWTMRNRAWSRNDRTYSMKTAMHTRISGTLTLWDSPKRCAFSVTALASLRRSPTPWRGSLTSSFCLNW